MLDSKKKGLKKFEKRKLIFNSIIIQQIVNKLFLVLHEGNEMEKFLLDTNEIKLKILLTFVQII